MPAPTNTSFLTATDLTSLPQTITAVADFGGTTYDLYYRIPASLVTAGINEIGIFGFGDLAVYIPSVTFWLGPAASPTRIVSAGSDWPKGVNFPIQVPTNEATEYFIKVAKNAGNPSPANLTLLVQAAPNGIIQAGDIVIPDDTVGFPCCILDSTADYTVRKFVHPYSSSEQGDILRNSGNTLMQRDPSSPYALNKLALYDNHYDLITLISFNPAIGNTSPAIRSNQTTQKFWVLYFNDPDMYAFSITSAGVTSAVESLGNTFIQTQAVATSPDESKLYFVEGSDSVIKVWDLVNHVALPDLIPRDTTHRVFDILVLSNGNLIIGYWKSSATLDFNVKHYSSAGALLNTYNFGSDISNSTPPRLAYSVDNSTSFWVYVARPSSGANRGKSNIYKVRISDGTFLVTRTIAQFNQGNDTQAPTATPLADFGASSSCPFFIASTSANTASGLYKLTGTNFENAVVRHDIIWTDPSIGTTENRAIPDPYFESYLAGDE